MRHHGPLSGASLCCRNTQPLDRGAPNASSARELGFEVDAVRQLLDLADDPNRPFEQADAIAQTHLADIDVKIVRLSDLRAEVQRIVEQCAHGEFRDCRVIEVLADHGQCLADQH